MKFFKWLIVILCLLVQAPPVNAAIALITSIKGNSTDSNGFTTGSADTTGANFIIIGVSESVVTGASVSDSKSNTWNALTKFNGAFSDRSFQFFYCESCTVGSGHTFTVSGTANFPSLIIAAFSGVASSSFDVQNGNTNGFAASVSTGSVTPSQDNELLIAGLQYDDSTTPTIDLGFSVLQTIAATGFGFTGEQMTYLIETTATAKNPTFSWTNNSRNVGVIATFKAAAAGGASPNLRALTGIGK